MREVASMSTYIDPHIHMISRVTDDYQRMAPCGCGAISEPAFWAGVDRGSAAGFRDYFRRRVQPARVYIGHVEEHTVRLALDAGFWCGMTLYPVTKCTPERAADILEMVGNERILANSAGDWGKSNPLAVPEFIQEMKRRGHAEAIIRKVVYDNPLAFFRQCSRWQDWPEDDGNRDAATPAIRGTKGAVQAARAPKVRSRS